MHDYQKIHGQCKFHLKKNCYFIDISIYKEEQIAEPIERFLEFTTIDAKKNCQNFLKNEKKLINFLRISRNAFAFDSLTFCRDFLNDIDNLFDVFYKFSEERLFLRRNEEQNSCLSSWFDYYRPASLSQWIVNQFETNILRYFYKKDVQLITHRMSNLVIDDFQLEWENYSEYEKNACFESIVEKISLFKESSFFSIHDSFNFKKKEKLSPLERMFKCVLSTSSLNHVKKRLFTENLIESLELKKKSTSNDFIKKCMFADLNNINCLESFLLNLMIDSIEKKYLEIRDFKIDLEFDSNKNLENNGFEFKNKNMIDHDFSCSHHSTFASGSEQISLSSDLSDLGDMRNDLSLFRMFDQSKVNEDSCIKCYIGGIVEKMIEFTLTKSKAIVTQFCAQKTLFNFSIKLKNSFKNIFTTEFLSKLTQEKNIEAHEKSILNSSQNDAFFLENIENGQIITAKTAKTHRKKTNFNPNSHKFFPFRLLNEKMIPQQENLLSKIEREKSEKGINEVFLNFLQLESGTFPIVKKKHIITKDLDSFNDIDTMFFNRGLSSNQKSPKTHNFETLKLNDSSSCDILPTRNSSKSFSQCDTKQELNKEIEKEEQKKGEVGSENEFESTLDLPSKISDQEKKNVLKIDISEQKQSNFTNNNKKKNKQRNKQVRSRKTNLENKQVVEESNSTIDIIPEPVLSKNMPNIAKQNKVETFPKFNFKAKQEKEYQMIRTLDAKGSKFKPKVNPIEQKTVIPQTEKQNQAKLDIKKTQKKPIVKEVVTIKTIHRWDDQVVVDLKSNFDLNQHESPFPANNKKKINNFSLCEKTLKNENKNDKITINQKERPIEERIPNNEFKEQVFEACIVENETKNTNVDIQLNNFDTDQTKANILQEANIDLTKRRSTRVNKLSKFSSKFNSDFHPNASLLNSVSSFNVANENKGSLDSEMNIGSENLKKTSEIKKEESEETLTFEKQFVEKLKNQIEKCKQRIFGESLIHIRSTIDAYNEKVTEFRHNAIDKVRQIVRKSFRNDEITIIPYGSFETGLLTPFSDIDLAIQGCQTIEKSEAVRVLELLEYNLKLSGFVCKTQLICSSAVSLLKIECFSEISENGVLKPIITKIDVIVNLNEEMNMENTALRTSAYVKKSIGHFKSFFGNVLVLKYIMNSLGFSNAYTGFLKRWFEFICFIADL